MSAPTPTTAPSGLTYLLRTCDASLRSYGGFQWPESGPVECPDWSPEPECGQGLHGLLMGEGAGSLLDWSPDAKWLVVEVEAASVVNLGGKVKVPRGVVVYCGDRQGAVADIIARGADPARVVGGTATAGDRGTATAGDYGTATAGDGGTATAGDYGTATAGDYGTATAGDYGTATAGDRGTATAGDYGTATAGDRGTVMVRYWDASASRYRIAVGYVGEGGIEAGAAYCVERGKLVRREG